VIEDQREPIREFPGVEAAFPRARRCRSVAVFLGISGLGIRPVPLCPGVPSWGRHCPQPVANAQLCAALCFGVMGTGCFANHCL